MAAQPVDAHTQYANSSKSGIIGGQQGFCVHGGVTQTHSSHEVWTRMSNCLNFGTTWHAQYQEYYKTPVWGQPGTYCFYEGWYTSGHQAVFTNYYSYDIWSYCNNGFNVNVWLSIDSWQYSWRDYVGWLGGAWRPATNHCHCP